MTKIEKFLKSEAAARCVLEKASRDRYLAGEGDLNFNLAKAIAKGTAGGVTGTSANTVDLHLDMLLTDLSVDYTQDMSDFVHSSMPIVGSSKQSNAYRVYDKRDAFTIETEQNGKGEFVEPAVRETRFSKDSYLIQTDSIAEIITEEANANDDLGTLATVKMRNVVGDSMRRREKEFADTIFKTGQWLEDASLSANQQFDNAASKPIQLFREKCAKIRLSCGKKANVAIFGADAWRWMLDNPQIIERIDQSSSPEAPAKAMERTIASLLEMDMVFVMEGGYYDAADLDKDDEDNAYFNSSSVFIGYVDWNASSESFSAFTQFVWTGLPGYTNNGTRTRVVYDQLKTGAWMIADSAYTVKVVSKYAGVLLTNTVSSANRITL